MPWQKAIAIFGNAKIVHINKLNKLHPYYKCHKNYIILWRLSRGASDIIMILFSLQLQNNYQL